MIESFRCKETKKIFNREGSKRFNAIERSAFRKLRALDEAINLRMLALLPGLRFEALKGNRKGQYSIRINKQWRICFK